jgi:predicted Zn-dependent peptidase
MQMGTSQFEAGAISRIIQAGGGYTKSSADLDLTRFVTKVSSRLLDTLLMLEADRMQNVEITYEKLLLAREAVRKDRLTYVESFIYGPFNEEFLNLAYRAHPYQHPRYGWPGDLKNIGLEELKEYFRKYFQPANATILISGDFVSEKAIALVDSLFSGIVSYPVPAKLKIVEPEQRAERRALLESASGIPVFLVGYHITQASHVDIPALRLIRRILVGGESSRLYERLVQTEKSALSVGGDLLELEDPGLIFFYCILNYDTPVEVGEEAILDEIERLKVEYVTSSELEKAKNRMEADFYRNTRTLDTRAGRIAFYQLIAGNKDSYRDEVIAARAVTKEDIMSVAARYFGRNNRTIITLTPTDYEPNEQEILE